MVQTQHNARIHLVSSAIVAIVGYGLHITANEWCWLIIAIASVWTAEALNTSIEFLCDIVSPDFHPLVEKSKDVAAGAVLCSAICSAAIGFIILGPKLGAILLNYHQPS